MDHKHYNDDKFVDHLKTGKFRYKDPESSNKMIPDRLCNPYFEDCDDECIPNVDLGCFCEAEGCFF